jgi:hypothetical protein
MENLICKCGHKFFVPRYRFIIKTSEYIDSNTKQLITCPECKSKEISSLPREGEFNVLIGEFSSADMVKRKEMIRKRAREHSKKTKEQTETIRRNWNGVADPKFY